MRPTSARIIPALGMTAAALLATAPAAGADTAPLARDRGGDWSIQVVSSHPTVRIDGAAVSPVGPDDLTVLDGYVFVAYQNGIGPTGVPGAPGGTDASTVIAYAPSGAVAGAWSLVGKVDGLGADREAGQVVATVNEDGNTSLYTITPAAAHDRQVTHYRYSPGNPLPHGGGTDSVVDYHGRLLISASAPTSATPATSPAVYQATLTPTGDGTGTAELTPYFFDGSTATTANTVAPTPGPSSPVAPYGAVGAKGTPVTLALTDPDSSTVVPHDVPQLGGDFVLDSQGDQQLVFARSDGRRGAPDLSVLFLNQSIDDSAWITRPGGAVYVTDASTDSLYRVTGPLQPGQALVAATPGDADNPGTASNYLGTLDVRSGNVAAVPALAAIQPHGLVYVPGDGDGRPGHDHDGR